MVLARELQDQSSMFEKPFDIAQHGDANLKENAVLWPTCRSSDAAMRWNSLCMTRMARPICSQQPLPSVSRPLLLPIVLHENLSPGPAALPKGLTLCWDAQLSNIQGLHIDHM